MDGSRDNSYQPPTLFSPLPTRWQSRRPSNLILEFVHHRQHHRTLFSEQLEPVVVVVAVTLLLLLWPIFIIDRAYRADKSSSRCSFLILCENANSTDCHLRSCRHAAGTVMIAHWVAAWSTRAEDWKTLADCLLELLLTSRSSPNHAYAENYWIK